MAVSKEQLSEMGKMISPGCPPIKDGNKPFIHIQENTNVDGSPTETIIAFCGSTLPNNNACDNCPFNSRTEVVI